MRIDAKDHPAGARRKIAPMRFGYPRYVGSDKHPLYAKENLEKGLFPWNDTVPLGKSSQRLGMRLEEKENHRSFCAS